MRARRFTVLLAGMLAGFGCSASELPLPRADGTQDGMQDGTGADAGGDPGSDGQEPDEPPRGGREPGGRPDDGACSPGSRRAVRGYRFDVRRQCGLAEDAIGLSARGGAGPRGGHACVVSPGGDLYVAFFVAGEMLCDSRWHRSEGETWPSSLTREEASACAHVLNVIAFRQTPTDDFWDADGLLPLSAPCDAAGM